jgi:hypothetical protein
MPELMSRIDEPGNPEKQEMPEDRMMMMVVAHANIIDHDKRKGKGKEKKRENTC